VIPALLPEDMPANARNGVIAAVATFGARVLQSNGVSARAADAAMPALAGVASRTTRKYRTELYGARGLPLADSVRVFQPRQGQHATVADTWLQDPRVREKAGNYARNFWLKNGRALTVGEFKLYVNDYCLCVLDTKTSRYVRVASIGRTSAHNFLVSLGWGRISTDKQFVDRHEDPNVVRYRSDEFCPTMMDNYEDNGGLCHWGDGRDMALAEAYKIAAKQGCALRTVLEEEEASADDAAAAGAGAGAGAAAGAAGAAAGAAGAAGAGLLVLPLLPLLLLLLPPLAAADG
jgi:hypothetical protein